MKAKDIKSGDRVTFNPHARPGDEISGVVAGDVTQLDAYVIFDVVLDDIGRRTFRIHRESNVGLEEHEKHLDADVFDPNCVECTTEIEALDWVECVRKYGLLKANEMFP